MITISNDGFVLFAGIYQLFHIKLIGYYCLGGIGGLWGYFLDNKRKNIKNTLKGGVFTFVSTILTIYLVIGALEYVFDVKEHAYVFFLAGYFSRYINAWIEAHAEEIVDKLSKKFFSRATDVSITGKDKKDNVDNGNQ